MRGMVGMEVYKRLTIESVSVEKGKRRLKLIVAVENGFQ